MAIITSSRDLRNFNRLNVDDVLDKISFEVVEKPLFYKDAQGQVRQSGSKSIIRVDDGTECGTVSNDYGLVTYRESMEAALEALQRRQYGFKDAYVSKSRMWLDAVAIDSPIRIGKDDYLPRVTLSNSYDGSGSIRCVRGLYRVVCLNGTMVVLQSGNHAFSIRHTKNAPVSLEEWVHRMSEENWITELQFTMRQLDAPLTQEQVIEVLAKYFKAEKKSNAELQEDERILDVIKRAYFGDGQSKDLDKPLTKLDVFNGITERLRDTVRETVSSVENSTANSQKAFKLLIAA